MFTSLISRGSRSRIHSGNGAAMRSGAWRLLAASCLMAGAASAANAGYVTTDEAGMDAIFSQSSFGANAVDIRFNPVQTIHDSALLSIDAPLDAELYTLSDIVGNSRSLGMFFVDSISYCGGPVSSTVGCALTPGNMMVLTSSYAASPSIGAVLASHELGHAAGLFHIDGANNLMNSHITSVTTLLLPEQVNTILNSGLIQIDGVTHQRYISITPYEVLASAVPEPSTLLMAGLGVAFVAGAARRVRRQA